MDSDKEQAIRERAYRIWEQEGREDGRHDEHWGRAAAEHESEAGSAAEASRTAAESSTAAKPAEPARAPATGSTPLEAAETAQAGKRNAGVP